MKILLIGKNGQVGWELQRSLLLLGEVISLDRSECDLSCPESIPAIIQSIKPDVIVNAAAYTAVDKAEEEELLATTVNSVSVGVIAEEAKKLNALFVHYSTDYVFDGLKSTPYTEDDKTNPVNAYGRSKLAGEKAIQASGCHYFIYRTSWVFASRGSNFIKTMLRLAAERDELKVVSDQIGAPTSAELIADITAFCLYRVTLNDSLIEQVSGIYHLAPAGETSWHGLAKYAITKARDSDMKLRVTPDKIHPIATSEYPMPAKRPANSRLNCKKLCKAFTLVIPRWQEGANRVIVTG